MPYPDVGLQNKGEAVEEDYVLVEFCIEKKKLTQVLL